MRCKAGDLAVVVSAEIRRKTGPVPDNRLQPIRGLPPGTLLAKPAESGLGAGNKAQRKRSIATIES